MNGGATGGRGGGRGCSPPDSAQGDAARRARPAQKVGSARPGRRSRPRPPPAPRLDDVHHVGGRAGGLVNHGALHLAGRGWGRLAEIGGRVFGVSVGWAGRGAGMWGCGLVAGMGASPVPSAAPAHRWRQPALQAGQGRAGARRRRPAFASLRPIWRPARLAPLSRAVPPAPAPARLPGLAMPCPPRTVALGRRRHHEQGKHEGSLHGKVRGLCGGLRGPLWAPGGGVARPGGTQGPPAAAAIGRLCEPRSARCGEQCANVWPSAGPAYPPPSPRPAGRPHRWVPRCQNQ